MEQVCVVIAGKMNNMMFQKAKAAAESLVEFHGSEGFSCEIVDMVPTEWEVYRENTTRALGGVMLTKSHKAPPLVFMKAEGGPGEYIGGLDEFLEWANSRYGYVDTTADLIYNMKAKWQEVLRST